VLNKPGLEKILKDEKIKLLCLNYQSLIEEDKEIFRYGKGEMKFDLKDKYSTLFYIKQMKVLMCY